MRINKNFLLREIAGETILVPTGEAAQNFNGMITLNGLGKFIFEHLDEAGSVENLVNMIVEVYDVDAETAIRDVNGFIDELCLVGIASEE